MGREYPGDSADLVAELRKALNAGHARRTQPHYPMPEAGTVSYTDSSFNGPYTTPESRATKAANRLLALAKRDRGDV